MAGFAMILGGGLKGAGEAKLEAAKAEREAALQEIRDRREMEFRSREAEIGRNFEASENEKNRAVTREASAVGKPTDDMREYEIAKSQGFKGSFMEYQIKMKEAGRSQVNVDTGEKLPSGFRWKDPNKRELGVEPIPGGPGEQMPSELAARIGLAQDALTKLDGVEQAAKDGKMTGVYDWAKGKIGKGEQGSLGRELAAGAEALTRMLTGAGMNMAEAQREASLYLPQMQDDAETLANKVSQLKRRLSSTIEMAGRGRGVESPKAKPIETNSGPAIGTVEGGYRFKGGDPADQSNWEKVN